MNGRLSWDQTWANFASIVAKRSQCEQAQVGAVIVTKDNRLASTGYNGPPSGLDLQGMCSAWCPRGIDPGERTGMNYGLSCLTIHAEVNAIMRCDWDKMQGGVLYTTRTPCQDCAKVIGNSGITRVEFPILDIDLNYRPEDTIRFLLRCGLDVRLMYELNGEELLSSD